MNKKKDTLMKLKLEERQSRMDLILDAAERVFERKPFNAVSMKEIADEAGIAKSTIYTYFPNQECLFIESVTKNIKNILDSLHKSFSRRKEDTIEEFINSFIDYMAEHESFYRMMTILMTNPNIGEESSVKINNLISMHLDLIDNIIFRDIAYEGNKRLLSHNMFALLNGIIVTFRKFPGRKENEIISHMKAVGKVYSDMVKNLAGNPETV